MCLGGGGSNPAPAAVTPAPLEPAPPPKLDQVAPDEATERNKPGSTGTKAFRTNTISSVLGNVSGSPSSGVTRSGGTTP